MSRGGYGGGGNRGGGGFGGRGGGFRGGRGGGFGGGGRGGGRGGFGGGRGRGGGGYRGNYDTGPPEEVKEFGFFTHPCEDDLVCKSILDDVPFFNAPIYLENKQQIGKIDEIFGPIRDYFVSIKLAEDVKANSFVKDQKLYIDPAKLLPLTRFLPGAPAPGGRGGRGGGRGRGGRGGGFGRGGGRGFGGRGGGFGGRGGRGGFDRGRGGFDRGRGGFDRGRGGFDRGRGGFQGGNKRSFDGGNFSQNKRQKFD